MEYKVGDKIRIRIKPPRGDNEEHTRTLAEMHEELLERFQDRVLAVFDIDEEDEFVTFCHYWSDNSYTSLHVSWFEHA